VTARIADVADRGREGVGPLLLDGEIGLVGRGPIEVRVGAVDGEGVGEDRSSAGRVVIGGNGDPPGTLPLGLVTD
jgi:hypothetical protein